MGGSSSKVASFTHSDWVTAADFSPNGELVVSGSTDGKAIVWSARTGKVVTTFTGHSDNVCAAEFSPADDGAGGELVVTGSDDSKAIVWSARTGEVVTTFTGHSATIRTASFSPNGELVVTGGDDGKAIVWSARSGEVVTTFTGHVGTATEVQEGSSSGEMLSLTLTTETAGEIKAAKFSPNGELVVTGSTDGKAIVWSASSGEVVTTFTGHSDWVYDAGFSPNGELVVTASEDATAIVWSASSGEVVTTFTGHRENVSEDYPDGFPVYTAGFSPDGELVVTGSGDKKVIVWSAKSGEAVTTFTGHSEHVTSARFSPDGELVVTASADKKAIVFDPGTLDVAALLAERGPLRLEGLDGEKFEVPWPTKIKRGASIDLRALAAKAHPQSVLGSARQYKLVFATGGTIGRPTEVSVLDWAGVRRMATGAMPTTATIVFSPK